MEAIVKVDPLTLKKITRISELSATFDGKGMSQSEIVDYAMDNFLKTVTQRLANQLSTGIKKPVSVPKITSKIPTRTRAGKGRKNIDWSYINWTEMIGDMKTHEIQLKPGQLVKFRSAAGSRAQGTNLSVSVVRMNKAGSRVEVKFSPKMEAKK